MVVKEYKKPAGVYKVQTFRTTHSCRRDENLKPNPAKARMLRQNANANEHPFED